MLISAGRHVRQVGVVTKCGQQLHKQEVGRVARPRNQGPWPQLAGGQLGSRACPFFGPGLDTLYADDLITPFSLHRRAGRPAPQSEEQLVHVQPDQDGGRAAGARRQVGRRRHQQPVSTS